MKKLLGISLVAALAVSPMMAMAAGEDYSSAPSAGTPQATVNAGPTFELVDETAASNIASTSYVKGAYNASIKAVNAEYARATGVEGSLSNLTTTEKGTLVGAINELDLDVGDKSTLTTTEKGSLVGAVNELDSDVGNLTTLTTTEKGSLVGAINEVNSAVSTATANIKEGVVATINHSGTVVHTDFSDDTKIAFAADTVRAADNYNYNKYYPSYGGTAETLTTANVAGSNLAPTAPAQP